MNENMNLIYVDYSVLEKNTLFSGLSAKTIREVLEAVPHHI